MKEKQVLTAQEAARILGCTSQKVRERMRRGLWDLGRAIPPEETGKSTWTYEIMRHKLEAFQGEEGKQ